MRQPRNKTHRLLPRCLEGLLNLSELRLKRSRQYYRPRGRCIGQADAQSRKEDFDKGKVLLTDAVRSGSYFYPITGIFYLAAHKSLWSPFLSRLVPALSLSAGVVASMFFFTYVPQLAVLVFVNGPLAVFTTVLLVLNESSAIVSVLSKNFLIQDALLDTFDGTLVAKGSSNIVSEGRQLKSGGDPIQRLGKILKSPFDSFNLKGLVRYVMYLPLNFIPGKSRWSAI